MFLLSLLEIIIFNMSLVAMSHNMREEALAHIDDLVDDCYPVFVEMVRKDVQESTACHIKTGSVFGRAYCTINMEFPVESRHELRQVAPRIVQEARQNPVLFDGITFEAEWSKYGEYVVTMTWE